MAPIASGWLFWAVLSALFAALTAILAKLGVQRIDSDLATLIRTLVVAAALVALLAATGKLTGAGAGLRAVPARSWLFLVLSGLATGASWLCYFRALKLGDASRVAPIDKLSVVFVAVLAAVLLGERLSAAGWTGIALIAAGAVLVAVS